MKQKQKSAKGNNGYFVVNQQFTPPLISYYFLHCITLNRKGSLYYNHYNATLPQGGAAFFVLNFMFN